MLCDIITKNGKTKFVIENARCWFEGSIILSESTTQLQYCYNILFQVLSEVGTVHTVLDSGDLRVRYPSNRVWTMNPDTVSIIEVRINNFQK